MRHAMGVLIVLLSALLLPETLEAQQGGATVGTQEIPAAGFRILGNGPNPFVSETRIRFELFEPLFANGMPAVVSVRIFDLLLQYVGAPTAVNHPAGEGTPVVNLEYTAAGRYEVLWDGRDSSGVPVPWGVYIIEVEVNGRPEVIRVTVSGG